MNTRTLIKSTSIVAFLSLTLAGCGGGSNSSGEEYSAAEPEVAEPSLADQLAASSRTAGDSDRDAGRKPVEVVAALGIEPGMKVIDVIAAGGYYTEVLSLAVGADGHVAAQNPAMVLQMREGANEKALSARLAGDRLANVSRLDKELNELAASDGPFDAAITALNLHDIYNNYGETGAVGAMKAISGVLKPGGVFGVIDHSGAAGNDNKALHRITVEDAIRLSESAGFVVEQNSGILHVHSDDLSQNVFGDSIRGKTNRFLLVLRKPAN